MNTVRSESARPPPSIPVQSPLPIQLIPSSISASVVAPDGKLAAIGALVRYSPNQAYFILQHLDEQLKKKAVTVSPASEDALLNLKIDHIQDELPETRFNRIYLQVFHNPSERLILEHLIDNLAESMLGVTNLELKKNITIDVFDSDFDAALRDSAGFIITDRLQFHQVTVASQELLAVLHAEPELQITCVTNPVEIEAILTYDVTLSAHQRSEFLQFLFSKSKVYAAKKDDVLLGYMVISYTDNRVLCLYADDQRVAETLLVHHLKRSNAKNAIFCTTKLHWAHLKGLSSLKSRTVHRRHSRAVPGNIKWERIFAVNVGMNLF